MGLLTGSVALTSAGIAIGLFGFFPGLAIRLITLIYPRHHLRRKELRAELHSVRFLERPFWVAEQLETALFDGLPARLWDERHVKRPTWVPRHLAGPMWRGSPARRPLRRIDVLHFDPDLAHMARSIRAQLHVVLDAPERFDVRIEVSRSSRSVRSLYRLRTCTETSDLSRTSGSSESKLSWFVVMQPGASVTTDSVSAAIRDAKRYQSWAALLQTQTFLIVEIDGLTRDGQISVVQHLESRSFEDLIGGSVRRALTVGISTGGDGD